LSADLDEAAWRNVFRQLVALGFAEPDHDAYGALKLTDASRPVLKGEQPVEMRQLQPRKGKVSKTRSEVAAGFSPADAGLLDQLKAWRLEKAREQSVPAYVILHDRTLAEIAALTSRKHGFAGNHQRHRQQKTRTLRCCAAGSGEELKGAECSGRFVATYQQRDVRYRAGPWHSAA